MVPERLSHWGVDIVRDDEGRVAYAKWPFPFGTAAVDPDMCHALAAEAKRLGVRFVDHVVMAELLTDGERIAGAAGFWLDDGAFRVFQAGAVVVAMGSQNYDIMEMWCGTGNGIRAAYLAGAEMRNVEFGNMCDFARVDARGWLYYGAHGARAHGARPPAQRQGREHQPEVPAGSAHFHGPGRGARLVQRDPSRQRPHLGRHQRVLRHGLLQVPPQGLGAARSWPREGRLPRATASSRWCRAS